MAAQRMPLGHKRRGEAAVANDPRLRSIRARYARGMRAAAQAKQGGQPGFKSGWMGQGIRVQADQAAGGRPRWGQFGAQTLGGFHG